MDKKIKQPIGKGVAKVPVIMQLEALECGAACLAMIMAYYGKWVPIEQVRADCGVSRDGSNAMNVINAGRYYGLIASGYRCEPEALKTMGSFPCIIHWNFNHFVVLNGFTNGKAYINDPGRGAYFISMEEFDKSFTGICIQFCPGENFEPSGKRKSMLAFARRRLKGTAAVFAFTVLTTVITSLMGVINPAFARVFMDRLLTGSNPDWLVPFFILLGCFSFVQILTSALSSVYNLRIRGKMAAVGSASYMWKVLHMPMLFFSQRMAGDIQGRQASNSAIANTLINTVVPLALNSIMMLFYLVIMVRYSWKLALIGISSILINALVSNYISKKRINITRVAVRDSAKLASATVAGIEMIETIKSSGAENGYFSKWSGYQANVNMQEVKFQKLNQYLGMIPQFMQNIANSAVLVAGVYLTMQGQFTAGMIMEFQSFLALFMAPAMTSIEAGQSIQEMRTEMERVDDVMEYPEDDVFADDSEADDEEYSKLSGRIELKDVVFGYSRLASPLIKNFNLSIMPGETIAIVGSSGCGKSTISKLISGLYKPWSGEILFDGKQMKEIKKNVFYGSLAVVDQDIILFEDTISNNIKMWDDSIENFEMILAARDAQLHNDIVQRKGGYQHKLIEGGRDFSGGQRQRMELARVLAQDPTIIVLDEATSALDAKTEYNVVKAIRERGITCIVIAHRLSTIRSCDKIVVMKEGEIVESGTHKELMENSALYYELVTCE